jgi:hypothetical protein
VIRVLIADYEALVRSGLRMILEAQVDMEVSGEADDGRTAGTGAPGLPESRADGHPHARHRRHRGHALAARPAGRALLAW